MNKFYFFRVLVCAFSLASVSLFFTPPVVQAELTESEKQDIWSEYDKCIERANNVVDAAECVVKRKEMKKILSDN